MMTKELKVIFKDKVQDALISLGTQPNTEEELIIALNNCYFAFPHLTEAKIIDVTIKAASGKFGIPYKFVPALVGSWFHKDERMTLESKRGIL